MSAWLGILEISRKLFLRLAYEQPRQPVKLNKL